MTLLLNATESIKVISRRDSAVGCDEETYKAYLESLDESLLELPEGSSPTRFVLRKVLPFAARQRIKNEQISYKGGQDVEVRLGFVLEEVRCAVIGIENPGMPKLEYKKDNDGFCSKEIIALLDAYGIVDELYAAYTNMNKSNELVDKKK